MISSIHIQRYRGLADLKMSGLERVNLLVGKNNSGKTSVLEAIFLLVSRGDPSALWQVLWRRGERLTEVERSRDRAPDMDISHLFMGHRMQIGTDFKLSAKNQTPERSLTFTLSDIKPEKDAGDGRVRLTLAQRLAIEVKGHPTPVIDFLPLSRAGGLESEVLRNPARLHRDIENELPAQFITAESLDGSDLVSLWDKVALTANEDRVLSALKFLDLDVERIAPQVGPSYYYPRGGFILKLRGSDHPVPVGSMGDGMWRMMAMAIAIAHCKDGVLLIDEIDIGLHYTVLANMWRLIFGAAKELNVQVFATTHSSDCIRSLAELCYEETDVAENVTLQRIERGERKSIPYTAAEIEMAAKNRVEVR
jgi:predicted ATPase